MPKKPMTPEQKKAWGAKMKAARAAKLSPVSPSAAPESDLDSLRRQFEELKSTNQALFALLQNPAGPQATRQGLVGTFEKYVVDPKNYSDPVERLSSEARLTRFAFKENYFLGFDVSTTAYQTQDGVNTKEPKFTLQLNRYIADEDTGELTGEAYTVCQMIFHEDPQAAIVVARENGVEVDESNEKAFLNEMRYLRMRDWLLECFYPPKPQSSKNKRQMVIGNRVVEVFEVNSEQSEKVPFDQLTKKL